MNKKLLTLAILPVVLSLSSCGGDTRDWPRISFLFTADDVIETRMYFHQKANRYVEEIKDSRISEEKEFAERVINAMSGYPYKEKATKSIDTKNYSILLDVQFTYLNDNVETLEKIAFYEYGISDGKVVFNNGEIHYLPGTVYAAYESIIDKESKK